MIRPILACQDPYRTAEVFVKAGWNLDFLNPPESGDPLVGVSLHDNSLLLGITDGYVETEKLDCIGCGVELYLTVPADEIHAIYKLHGMMKPTALTIQPWGDLAFEVSIDNFKLIIAAQM